MMAAALLERDEPRAVRPEHEAERRRALLEGVAGVGQSCDAADLQKHVLTPSGLGPGPRVREPGARASDPPPIKRRSHAPAPNPS